MTTKGEALKKGYFQPMTLDVDDGILDRNLKIISNSADEELSSIFPGLSTKSATIERKTELPSLLPEPDYPSVQVTPEPGMCIKTHNISGEKVFINLCKIQEIPPAPPLAEEKLQEIIISEDYTSDYRVPMSLGAPRQETDKSGQTCTACDVAINSIWYTDTMVKSLTFTTFVINLAMEGLCDKYGDQVNLDRQNWTILKNKKYLGALQRHHIQQRPGLTKIQEIGPSSSKAKFLDGPKIVELDKTPVEKFSKPEYKFVTKSNGKVFEARVQLPAVKSSHEILLDVGEDRLIVSTTMTSIENYLLDVFLPLKLDGSHSKAKFIRDKRTLFVQVPIIP